MTILFAKIPYNSHHLYKEIMTYCFATMLDTIKKHQFKFLLFFVLLLLPILLMLLELQMLLRYQGLDHVNHEYWRWLTGHWVHLTWGHLWMNWLALLILFASFFDSLSVKGWLSLCVSLSILTSAAMLIFSPELQWYVGLSGILHGLLVFLVLQDPKLSRIIRAVFLVGLSIKLLWEQVYGALPGSEQLAGGNVVVDAHLYGAVAGFVHYIIFYLLRRSWGHSY